MKTYNLLLPKITASIVFAGICYSFLCSNNVFTERPKSTLEKMGLKGKVKSIINTEYDGTYESGEIHRQGINSVSVQLFNKYGNETELAYYNPDGSLRKKNISKYDNMGNKVEMASYNPDNSLDWRSFLKYDEKGNEIEEARYISDGELDWKSILRYDGRGNMFEQITTNSEGDVESKIMNKFDEKGFRVEEYESSFSGVDEFRYKSIFKNDENGNVIECKFYDYINDNITLFSYKYDTNGRKIEEISNFKDKIRTTYSVYKNYDESGNWLIYIEIGRILEPPIEITERRIEYYSD